MDWRRIVPIIGFAFVSYLLVLQWSEYDTANNTETAADSGAFPTAEAPQTNSDDSALPEFQANNQTENQQTTGPAPAVPGTEAADGPAGNGSVTFETGEMLGRIDLTTGDLTELALKNHTTSVNSDTPLRILESNNQRVYTAQSGLLNRMNSDVTRSGTYSAARSHFQIAQDRRELRIPLQKTLDNGQVLTKTYIVPDDTFDLQVEFTVRNNGDATSEYSLFGQVRRDRSSDPGRGAGFAMASFLGVATTSEEDRYIKIDFGDMDDRAHSHTYYGGWIGFLQHYFLSAWVPPQNQTNRFFARENNGLYYAGFTTPAKTVAPGGTETWETTLFVGPKIQEQLDALADNLELTVDFGWLWWAAQPLFQLMKLIHEYVGNWGWTIVLLTLTVKLVFSPLSAKAYRSMAKMRKFAPKMQELKEQYGDDRQKMAQETMKLYKKEKINPLGGCLPMLVQMPVFISLYWVFMESVELRHSPFIFWIQDLSSRDPYFILPLIFGATMFLQMKLGAQPTDPMQAKVMKFLPIGFTAFFLLFPAGLVLYWVVNNSLSIAQQQYINWRVMREDDRKPASG